MNICALFSYWLLFAQYVIDWRYFMIDTHLYENYVIMDVFVSLFVSLLYHYTVQHKEFHFLFFSCDEACGSSLKICLYLSLMFYVL